MAGKGGGAWKVAYADFVTAMMAFFLVMWITAQNTKVKQAIAHYFNQADEPPKRPVRRPRDESSDPPKFVLQPVTPSLTEDPSDPESRVPRVLTIREDDQTSMATVVFFSDDSAELDEAAQKRLQRLMPWILGKPHKIEIRGHATDQPPANASGGAADADDERAWGGSAATSGEVDNPARRSAPATPAGPATSPQTPEPDPWRLSYARCLAVKKFMEAKGIAPHRLRLSQAGPHEPMTTRSDLPRRGRNPRVEVFVLSEHVRDFVGTRDERAKQEESH